jgi:Chaperonin GroEL (HSP60 family)
VKKRVIPGDEAKKQILEGAKLLHDAVSVTLGPKGQNAVIESYGEPIVTHDGVTVAKAVDVLEDDRPGIRVGVDLIKSSSSKTNDNVGDGTTSSTILAYKIIEKGMEIIESGANPMILRRELDKGSKEVLAELEKLSTPIRTKEDIIQIATISSEDKDIGKQVGTMYHKLGKDATVTVELGTKPDTEYEIVEGFTFDRGYADPHMVTDPRTQTAVLANAKVLITPKKVSLEDAVELLQHMYNDGMENLLIVADDFKQDILDFNLTHPNKVNVLCVRAPGFGEMRGEWMKDIAAFTDAAVDNEGKYQQSFLGTCEKVVSSAKETVITGGKDVSNYIDELVALQDTVKTELEREKIQKRITQLRAKVGVIRVGGATEMEAEERKYLIDDATCATEAALKEGIVPGGGTTYVYLSKMFDGQEVSTGKRILLEALLAPFKILMENSGERSGVKLQELKEFGKGFDVMGDGSLIDLREHGIIDPVLVIKQAITNAVSVAGSALTTGVLIVNEREKDEEKE